MDLERSEILAFIGSLGAQALAFQLCFHQPRALGRFLGDNRQLQARIVEEHPAQAERIVSPDLYLGQSLAYPVTLDRMIVDEQKRIKRETEFVGNRANVIDLSFQLTRHVTKSSGVSSRG